MFFSTFVRARTYHSVSFRSFLEPSTSRNFSSAYRRLQDEVHRVHVGGSGLIDLTFIKPVQVSAKLDYLIYFRPGPFPKRCWPSWPSTTASDIAKSLPTTTVIDVQYRLAPRDFSTEIDHRYPTPVHDVYAAFDYVHEIVEEQTAAKQHSTARIAIYGSHIGGALALSLALTSPTQIHGVCVENPMVDWPILEEIANLSSTKRKRADNSRQDTQLAAAKALIVLRSSLFRTPSSYFDSFASPVLFLRAPGRDTPLTNSTAPASGDQGFFQGSPIRYGEEDDEVGLVEYEDHAYGPYDDEWHAAETTKERNQYYRIDDKGDTMEDQPQRSHDQGNDSGSEHEGNVIAKEQQSMHPRRRKVLQRWPPNNAHSEEVMLPLVSILCGSGTIRGDGDATADDTVDISLIMTMQAAEVTELLRRACFWGREKSLAEERVTLTTFDESTNIARRRDILVERLTSLFA